MSTKLKNNKGITLIALIITIIILVILAAVSIRAVYNMGIVDYAIKGTQQYAGETVKENQMLGETGNLLDRTLAKLNDIQGNENGGSIDITKLQTPTTKPYLPDSSFRISEIEGEQTVDEGLVITDGTNEFVWIEVPMTAAVYDRTGLKADFKDLDVYELIEADLKAYISAYSDSNYSDTYSEYMGTIGSIDGETAYYTLKNKMLRSIYENGGFWIGRYETGNYGGNLNISNYYNRNGNEVETAAEMGDGGGYIATWSGGTAVSNKDMKPYNWVTLSQAQSLAEEFKKTGFESSLMFGLQWDLVLKFIENNSSDTTITTDSKTWGNYYDASFDITSDNAQYSSIRGAAWNYTTDDTTGFVEEGKKLENNDGGESYNGTVLLTTGASTYTKRKNIYDLAGNVMEWTLEQYNSRYGPGSFRGGNFYSTGQESPACSHWQNATSYCYYEVGFRVSLFK